MGGGYKYHFLKSTKYQIIMTTNIINTEDKITWREILSQYKNVTTKKRMLTKYIHEVNEYLVELREAYARDSRMRMGVVVTSKEIRRTEAELNFLKRLRKFMDRVKN
jgi:ABC-type Fe2+-enterobactin transport system substrate-binding protein